VAFLDVAFEALQFGAFVGEIFAEMFAVRMFGNFAFELRDFLATLLDLLGVMAANRGGRCLAAGHCSGRLDTTMHDDATDEHAITLAGVLTFPLAMPDGSPFPARALCILIAAGVIVLSLAWASVSLPRLLAGLTLPPVDNDQDEEDRVRVAAAQAALRAVQRAQERLSRNGENADLYAEAAEGVLALYRNRLEGRRRTADRSSQGRRLAEAEQRLWLAGLRAEREEIFKQARSRRIGDQTARKLVRELDLLEARIVH